MLFDKARRVLDFGNGISTGPLVGPGRYEVPRLFGMPGIKVKKVKSEKSITDLLRELDPEYDFSKEKETFSQNLVIITKKYKPDIPFSVTSQRFKHSSDNVPGVGSYNFVSFTLDLPKKTAWQNLKQVAFDTTYPKSPNRSPPHLIYPGPGYYNIKEKEGFGRKETAPFACQVPRSLLVPSYTPGVGHYDISNALDKLRNKKEFHKICFDGNQSFNTSAPREKCDVQIDDRKVSIYRGPGRYNVKNEEEKDGISMGKDKRFRRRNETTPGPGAYHLSPFYAHTVLTKTFNRKAAQEMNRSLRILEACSIGKGSCVDTSWIDAIDPKEFVLAASSQESINLLSNGRLSELDDSSNKIC